MASADIERVPLGSEFRFVHEPLGTAGDVQWGRFVGRNVELEDFVSRIVLSNGGAFLLTGYRGVGKTSFVNRVIHQVRERLPQARTFVGEARVVDIAFNFARPLEPVELLHHIVRALYKRLLELDVFDRLDPLLREDIKLAVARTSATIAVGNQSEVSSQVATGDIAVRPIPIPLLLRLQRSWKSASSRNMTYLAYDEKAAEYDLINIAQRLTRGYVEPSRRLLHWPPWHQPTRVGLKVVMVFDELDKLEDDGKPAERSPLDRVLGTLKNLFTASGLTFIFVAGKALHERWLEDLSRGDSVYESVFAHAQYLSGMWADIDSLCSSLAGAANGACSRDTPAYAAFRKYLAFKGRGIPRRTIRGFNEFVKWDAAPPRLEFGQADVRRFRFYAGLLDALVNAEEELLGRYRGEGSVEELDKRRLGLYYATDWILQRQQHDFTLDDLVAASRRMSRLITPVEEAAPGELQRLLDVLVRSEHVERVDAGAQTLVAGVQVSRSVRYRLPRRRLLELGAFLGVFEQEANVLFKQGASRPTVIGQDTDVGHSWQVRYEVISRIGQGGMSSVYRARDRRTGVEVAVKELSSHLVSEAPIRNRAIREARLLGSMKHPSIVRVLDVMTDDASVVVVMEFVEGSPLNQVLRHGAIPDLGVARRLMADLASAVAYIHQMDVVWRDPKPANVIVTPEGRIVVLDFGISRQLTIASTDTRTGMLIGTPGYMSPEQISGESVGTPSDIYGLGSMFFEIVTGRRAYVEVSPPEIFHKILTSASPRPSDVNKNAEQFDEVIGRCLAKSPKDRPSASELSGILESGASGHAELGRYIAGLQERSVRQDEERTAILGETLASPPPHPITQPQAPRPVSDTVMMVPTPAPSTVVSVFAGPRIEFIGSAKMISIVSPVVRIGRSTDNDIVLDDKAVSRYACVIKSGDTVIVATGEHTYYVEELNSVNSIQLNGKTLSGITQLQDDDVLTLGSTQLRFRLR